MFSLTPAICQDFMFSSFEHLPRSEIFRSSSDFIWKFLRNTLLLDSSRCILHSPLMIKFLHVLACTCSVLAGFLISGKWCLFVFLFLCRYWSSSRSIFYGSGIIVLIFKSVIIFLKIGMRRRYFLSVTLLLKYRKPTEFWV